MTNRMPATPAIIAQSRMVVVEPISPRPFLEHVLQGAERDRHQDDAGIVGALSSERSGSSILTRSGIRIGDGEAGQTLT